MSWKRQIAKVLALFAGRKPVDDLEEEIRSHLGMEEQENLESGMPRDEAHYAALRRFGNVTLAQERSREMWGWNSPETLRESSESKSEIRKQKTEQGLPFLISAF
ncbi:MAG: permease prefix domain 1-containing protein [Terriglobia bacterium]